MENGCDFILTCPPQHIHSFDVYNKARPSSRIMARALDVTNTRKALAHTAHIARLCNNLMPTLLEASTPPQPRPETVCLPVCLLCRTDKQPPLL